MTVRVMDLGMAIRLTFHMRMLPHINWKKITACLPIFFHSISL